VEATPSTLEGGLSDLRIANLTYDGRWPLFWNILLQVLPYTNILILWSFNIFVFHLKLAELVFVRIDIRFHVLQFITNA
jgi:hypothetical protein